MEIPKVTFQIDKSIAVAPGKRVITDYVAIESVQLACKDRMSIGDINEKYQLVLQNSPNCIYPTPMGYWNEDKSRFVIVDGRHTTMAYMIMGYSHILVSWIE